jgi:hypothetical protein
MTTRRIGPARLTFLFLFLPAVMAAGACGDSGGECAAGPCLDIAAVENSRVNVQLLPDFNGREEVALSVALPDPATSDACWRIPVGFEVRANGHSPTKISVTSGGDAPLSLTCSPGQALEARFDVPITPDKLVISFSREGHGVSVEITRPVPGPVDVTAPGTPVDRHATFPVQLRADAGSLPTSSDCWTAVFGWVRTDRFETATVRAEPAADGVDLQLEFPVELDVPAGDAVLQLISTVGPGCEPPPTVACPDVAGCSVDRLYGRRLGPFPLTFL